jgi:hypothetical protein
VRGTLARPPAQKGREARVNAPPPPPVVLRRRAGAASPSPLCLEVRLHGKGRRRGTLIELEAARIRLLQAAAGGFPCSASALSPASPPPLPGRTAPLRTARRGLFFFGVLLPSVTPSPSFPGLRPHAGANDCEAMREGKLPLLQPFVLCVTGWSAYVCFLQMGKGNLLETVS